ncbi:lipopolysaccharide biosynthesis protein [Hufsiella ginkgonis]|uniref:Oligosaccharide flippase family protein n=1 Tax=Hufsiella ginkgonis TaxID=2695274 RepID=A0A7K1Y2G5_9SPHI|nr:polysaccharide biosynthesis C-terminal domain-containing protein [Hufsiella ginkgonis]MXV17402.1 hypothetical protein [Hufsiella ginkgonis]
MDNGNDRDRGIKRNIIYTFLIKGLNILITFVLVRIAIDYVSPVQYGIWLVIASLVAWINTFDIGLSNGLRNKLAHAAALGETGDVRKYVSTTYAILAAISGTIFILFALTGSFLDWNALLRIQGDINYSIWPVMLITMGSFCMQFVLQPINNILIALQQPFKASLIAFSGQLLTLLFIGILVYTTHGSLILLVLAVCAAPLLVLGGVTFYLFTSDLKHMAPKWKYVEPSAAKGLLTIGGAFFIIQVGTLVLYETDTIIITRMLGPLAVTRFNNAFKYFSVITLGFTIIATPYWSAFTDAYARGDLEWIKASMRRMRLVCCLLMLPAGCMYYGADLFYHWWLGNLVEIPGILSLMMAIYTIVQGWMMIHAYLLNGAGKLRIQLLLVIAASVINIPLSVWLIRVMGTAGTVLANSILMFIISVFLTWQCELIMQKKATGIWSR